MKYKFRVNYLDIDNYKEVESYLEGEASQGWLIKNIRGSLFIFERIEPRDLEFSIAPYEVETAYTRKSLKELREYEEVCSISGWTLAARSFNLFVYYKDRSSQALEIHSDPEVEFELIKKFANFKLKYLYIFTPILILMSISRLNSLANNIDYIRSGFLQLPIILMVGASILGVLEIFKTRKFIAINTENIDLARDLEFRKGRHYFNKIFVYLSYGTIGLSVIYLLYSFIILRNKISIIALTPIFISYIVGYFYRMKLKTLRISKKGKKASFFLAILLASFIGSAFGIYNLSRLDKETLVIDREANKLIRLEDFFESLEDEEETILRDTSFLVPKSYVYINRAKEGTIENNYLKAISETEAKRLVEIYKEDVARDLASFNSGELRKIYKDRTYRPLDLGGEKFREEDFRSFKDLDLNKAVEGTIDQFAARAIREVSLEGWDQAYFLRKDASSLVLRRAREVYKLDGLDFSKEENLAIVLEKLSN